MSAPSDIQICNLALVEFGEISVSSITEPSTKQERACAVLYPQMRDKLLAEHPWNFAMDRADISAQVATAPAFEFDYAYTIPSDCIRVWEFYGYTGTWVVENGQLLTDAEEEIYIRYIKYVTETGRFPPAFVACLAKLLGAKLAVKLAGKTSVRDTLMSELEKIELPRARSLNAIEGNPNIPVAMQGLDEGNFSWQTEGR